MLALPSGPKGQLSGEQVYSQVCKTCHEGGLAGAPKVGDKAAWAKVIAQGLAPTVDHAIKGIRAMPPKGGNPDLENIEVERAVVFMANKAGANWKEPPAAGGGQGRGAHRRRGRQPRLRQVPRDRRGRRAEDRRPRGVDAARGQGARHGDAGGAEGPRRHAGARRHGRAFRRRSQARDRIHVEFRRRQGRGCRRRSPPRRAGGGGRGAAGGKPDGKKIYDTTCAVCHGAGVAGAPKFGDKAAWAPRLKTGIDALYASALKGKGAMPAKGGNASLADADVKAAVDYMAAAAK